MLASPLPQCLWAPNLVKVLTYHEGLLPKKLQDPLITRPSKITWQIKTIISSLLQCLWPPSLAGSWHIITNLVHLQKSYERFQPLELNDLTLVTWQIDKIKYSLSQGLWPLNLAGCWLMGVCSERKRLSCHRLPVVFLFFHHLVLVAVSGRIGKSSHVISVS